MNLDKIHRAYFIGIGGIGMSALARYFKSRGAKVSGYDRTETAITKKLQAEGMPVHYSDDINLADAEADLIVYTPAIPKNHKELTYFFSQKKYEVLKRSEVLEEVTADQFTIAVGGSHGKTTVTAMISHILKHTGYDCTAFIGGMTVNYDSNFLKGDNDTYVVEADEFDRSFLRLKPSIAVITAVDTDHLDIYGSKENIEDAFLQFAGNVREEGAIIINSNVSISNRIKHSGLKTYSLIDKTADFHINNLKILPGKYVFDISAANVNISDFTLRIGGIYNVENALAAYAVSHTLGIEDSKIKDALYHFKGIRRRYEYIINRKNRVYIDDYAHHPEEIRSLLTSVRKSYPDKRITAVFQPHLYSRTRDLAEGFAESLSLADDLILLPIYPAREEPIPGVSSQLILDQATVSEKSLMTKDELIGHLSRNKKEVLLTIGAGDIDKLVQPIKEALDEKS